MTKTPMIFRSLCLLLACAPAIAQQASVESAWARNQRGMQAYEQKDYAGCAAILTALSADPASRSADTRYNAACCQALAGHPDRAVPLLEQASEIDLLSVAQVEQDSDLASVRAMETWPGLRGRLAEREHTHLAGMNRELRNELARRVALDQDTRGKLIAAGNPPPQALNADMARIDQDNTAWAKAILAKQGWPGYDLIGKDGAGSFFLLVQHADADPAFQKQALDLMKAAVDRRQASAGQLAYLTDRVLSSEGKPQRYGTQFTMVDGKLAPEPIEDAEHVDARRLALGMPTMAEYEDVMRATYKPAAEPAEGKSN